MIELPRSKWDLGQVYQYVQFHVLVSAMFTHPFLLFMLHTLSSAVAMLIDRSSTSCVTPSSSYSSSRGSESTGQTILDGFFPFFFFFGHRDPKIWESINIIVLPIMRSMFCFTMKFNGFRVYRSPGVLPHLPRFSPLVFCYDRTYRSYP